jgi:hypothetical protein
MLFSRYLLPSADTGRGTALDRRPRKRASLRAVAAALFLRGKKTPTAFDRWADSNCCCPLRRAVRGRPQKRRSCARAPRNVQPEGCLPSRASSSSSSSSRRHSYTYNSHLLVLVNLRAVGQAGPESSPSSSSPPARGVGVNPLPLWPVHLGGSVNYRYRNLCFRTVRPSSGIRTFVTSHTVSTSIRKAIAATPRDTVPTRRFETGRQPPVPFFAASRFVSISVTRQ